jgi:hypothetical protein
LSRDFTPKPYQGVALDFLKATPRANLFADMGLGKTAVVLSLIREFGLDDVLVVAPLRVAKCVWPAEQHKWNQFQGLGVEWIGGTTTVAKTERQIHLLATPRIATINYEILVKMMMELGTSWPFKTVVCDESRRLAGFRIRYSTKRSRALARYAHDRVERWINLTGTPNPNGLTDLWGPQWFIDGGKSLGRTYGDFQDRWFYRSPRRKTPQYAELLPHAHAQKEIEDRMRATTLSIRARDWFDVREPVENVVWIDLPASVRFKYREMERHFYAEFERGVVTAANCAVKVGKLLQIVSGAVYHAQGDPSLVHDEKLEALRSIAVETSANLLIVYQYVSELERIKRWFNDAVDIRDKGAIDAWNRGEISKLCCHPSSAGHGLNLQDGGHHIVFFTPTFDAELYNQVLQRIGPVRQLQSGYDRLVYVHHILARGTIDTAVKTRREGKETLMELLLDHMRGELA